MKKTRVKVTFNRSGCGSTSTRVTIPITWLREMGINDKERDINIYKIDNKIILTKDEIKTDLEIENNKEE